MSLLDYISGLPTTYRDYDVQREIVSNVYLDNLVDTVLKRQHIPPIVLVSDAGAFKEDDSSLALTSFKILDGLQRTFRLQAIWSTVQFCKDNPVELSKSLLLSRFQFSRSFSKQLHDLDSNTDILRSVLEDISKNGFERTASTFSENNQWFEVWTGLSDSDEVRKMLLLNAGHKPVSTRHQLELLFLNLLPTLRGGDNNDFTLVRERDASAAQFSKNRKHGEFHFAHIIAALLSLIAGKAVTTSTELIRDLQNDALPTEIYRDYTNPEFLRHFVAFLIKLDRLLSEQFGALGTIWMAREVSLAGLFGALGANAKDNQKSKDKSLTDFLEILRKHKSALNLEQFETVRNSVDLSKINIGTVNRNAVFSAITSLLNNPAEIDWRVHFKVSQS